MHGLCSLSENLKCLIIKTFKKKGWALIETDHWEEVFMENEG